jgi:hypothetical protein
MSYLEAGIEDGDIIIQFKIWRECYNNSNLVWMVKLIKGIIICRQFF